MSKVTLITGGSRSGKSSYAESLLSDTDDVLYIATAVNTDEEMSQRISRHRQRRNSTWLTHEGCRGLDEAVRAAKRSNVLLDCCTIMITNLLLESDENPEGLSYEQRDALTKSITAEFDRLIAACRETGTNLIMVTNEVGWSLISPYPLGRIFTDIAGFVNQHLARVSDEVYMVVCGLQQRLK